MTSRWRLIDAVNLIAEEIAFASHCQELINNAQQEWDTKTIDHQRDLLQNSINNRRKIMWMIKEKYKDHNKNLWCSLKHAIWAYQFATECLYADQDNEHRREIQQNCFDQMVKTLTLFCWIDEIVTCSRCLEDMLITKG